MNKRMNKRIIFLMMLAGLFSLVSLASVAAIEITNPLGATDTFCKLLTNIASGVGELIAILGTIMIIIAGFLFMTSAGSPEKIKTAKTALMYAIIGMVIGGLAAAIVATIKSVINAAGGGC